MAEIKCDYCGRYYDEMYGGALNNGSPACPTCVEDEEREEKRKQLEKRAQDRKTKMYFYNIRTGALHINGYCGQSNPYPCDIKFFDTEKEARDFAGEKIFMCKSCQKKREKIIKGT